MASCSICLARQEVKDRNDFKCKDCGKYTRRRKDNEIGITDIAKKLKTTSPKIRTLVKAGVVKPIIGSRGHSGQPLYFFTQEMIEPLREGLEYYRNMN